MNLPRLIAWRYLRRPTDALVSAVGAVSVFGLVIGVQISIIHFQVDPLADVRAYYDAGARLNAGIGLYEQAVGTNEAEFYRYPPLLALVFRPLALLPFEVAAAIWEGVVVAAFVLTLRRIGRRACHRCR